MIDPLDWLRQDDESLLAECDVHIYKASGPGGQHRNKVSSAIRLRHRPSEISAVANDSRSQHDNRRQAIRRLRVNLACRCRTPREIDFAGRLPAEVESCFFTPRKGPPPAGAATRKLQVGRKDARYILVAAVLLDLLDGAAGQLGAVAGALGVSTGNVVKVLRDDRHVFAAAQEIRKAHGQKPIQ